MINRPKYRIGVVSFLNAWPLTEDLQQHFPDAEIISLVPSILEKKLFSGEIDVALLSSITYASISSQIRYLPDLGISSDGEVASVNLFIRPDQLNRALLEVQKKRINAYPLNTLKPDPLSDEVLGILLNKIRSVNLDPASKTSNALLQILLGTFLENKEMPHLQLPDLESKEKERIDSADATLLIGDMALEAGRKYPYIDLGLWWKRSFHLPFIYALWQIRSDLGEASFADIQTRLQLAYRTGRKKRESYAAKYLLLHPHSRLKKRDLVEYLTNNIHYELGERHIEGLQKFYEKLSKTEM